MEVIVGWIEPLVMPPAVSPFGVYEIDKKNKIKVIFPLSAHKIILLDLSMLLFALLGGDDWGPGHNSRAARSSRNIIRATYVI